MYLSSTAIDSAWSVSDDEPELSAFVPFIRLLAKYASRYPCFLDVVCKAMDLLPDDILRFIFARVPRVCAPNRRVRALLDAPVHRMW